MVFEGFLGIFKEITRQIESAKGKGKQQTLLQDVNAGTLLGAELHLFDFPNLFTSETCEKTKLLEIDRIGFDLFMKEFVRAKYAKYE